MCLVTLIPTAFDISSSLHPPPHLPGPRKLHTPPLSLLNPCALFQSPPSFLPNLCSVQSSPSPSFTPRPQLAAPPPYTPRTLSQPPPIHTHHGAQGFFNKLGNESKGGFGAGKAPFWERPTFILWSAAQPDPEAAETVLAADEDFQNWKKKYDRSRRTVTRTGEYELAVALRVDEQM